MGKKEIPKRLVTVLNSEGHPLYSAEVPRGMEDDACREGEFWIDGEVDAGVQFVNPATKRRNKLREMKLTVSANRIGNIPAGATAFFRGVKTDQIEDGELVFDCNYADAVTVLIQCPLYLPTEVEVQCEGQA